MSASAYVGRVGALAVSLGIGVAVAGMGSAAASPGDSSSAGAAADSGSARAGARGAAPEKRRGPSASTSIAAPSKANGGIRSGLAETPDTSRASQGLKTASSVRAPSRQSAPPSSSANSPTSTPMTTPDEAIGVPGRSASSPNLRADFPAAPPDPALPAAGVPASASTTGPDMAPTATVMVSSASAAPVTEVPAMVTEGTVATVATVATDTLIALFDQLSGCIPGGPGQAVSWMAAAAARREFDTTPLSAAAAALSAAAAPTVAVDPLATLPGGATPFLQVLRYTFFNQSPIANPVQATESSDSGVISGNLNAVGPAGAVLTYSIASNPGSGTAEISSDGIYTFTPNVELAATGGVDSFTVTIDGGSAYRLTGIAGMIQGIFHSLAQLVGLSGPDTIQQLVNVTVAAPVGNRAPIFGTPPAAETSDAASGVISGHIFASDPDGDTITYSLAEAPDPVYASVTLDPDTGAFTFTPTQRGRYRAALSELGRTMTFAVTASDGEAATTIDIAAPVLPLHPADDGTLDLADLDTLAEYGAIELSEADDGRISAIIGAFTNATVANAADAAQVLNQVANVLGADGTLTGDISTRSTGYPPDSGGVPETFYRLAQTVDGIPVLGSDIVLSTTADGSVTGAFSGINPAIYQLDTTPVPTIGDAPQAIAAANRILLENLTDPLTEDQQAALLGSLTSNANLVIYSLDPETAPALAWRVNQYSTALDNQESAAQFVETGLPLISGTVYIFANGQNAGNLLAADNGVQDASAFTTITAQGLSDRWLNPRVYRITLQQDHAQAEMIDPVRRIRVYNGTVLYSSYFEQEVGLTLSADIVTKGPSGWDKSAVSALGNMAAVYDYYQNVLRLNSIFPSPGWIDVGVVDSVDGESIWNGAFLNFTFGHDAEGALDVVGHEYTHAVIQSILSPTSTVLEPSVIVHPQYSFGGMAGDALDEAYGDIIGNLIEGKADDGRWLVGEDNNTKPYRDMKSPSQPGVLDPGPSYFSGYFDPDKGGHYYANIIDHAAYLMVSDERTIGVSNVEWTRVFYGSMQRTPANPTFLDARTATIAAAREQGFDDNQLAAIREAFDAVGIRANDRIKVVLTWGESPRDLDSHLTGSGFHVYYANKQYYQNGQLTVDLDYDDTSSYGPESTTIRKLIPGDYYFYVHDFTNGGSSNSTALSHSGATVAVFLPGRQDIGAVYFSDGVSPGTTWTVFKLTIDGNGNAVLWPINTYDYTSV